MDGGLMLALAVYAALFQEIERYPFLLPEVQAHYLSSFDRSGGNDDGFNGTYSALYQHERGEQVIFDVKGPGVVYTIWFTSRENGWAPLGWGRIRFYFDEESTPRLDLDADELFRGRRAPFLPPLVFDSFASSGGYACYVPFPFQRRLRITTQNRVGFYNIYYHTYSPDRRIESWTGQEDLSELIRIWTQPGIDPKPRREGQIFSGTVALPAPALPDGELVPSRSDVLTWEGVGAVSSLRLNPLFPLSPYQLNHLWLRIYWDGGSSPSVDAPLGSFFGSGLGEASVRSVLLGMSPSGVYYCYFPMPFWKSARIELVNENPEPTPPIWWEVRITPENSYPYPKGACGYFNARYQREWPTTSGQDYRLLETSGRGIYLGQVMTVEPLRGEVKRWWEGDLRVYIDGRRQPAFHGTGHEDEYLGGWSNEWLMNPYSLPLHGQPRTQHLSQIDFQWNAATTVYRFFPGGVPYQSQIAVSTEHGDGNSAEAMYSSVAFYYQQPVSKTLSDALDVGNREDEARHSYRSAPASTIVSLASQFEGIPQALDLQDQGREISGSSRFTLKVAGSPSALRLRRLYDQRAAQEAEVWVDGKPVGTWYSPAVNPKRRWAEADFLLPVGLTAGRHRLDVEIRVTKGTWTEYRYELWAIP